MEIITSQYEETTSKEIAEQSRNLITSLESLRITESLINVIEMQTEEMSETIFKALMVGRIDCILKNIREVINTTITNTEGALNTFEKILDDKALKEKGAKNE